MKKTIAAVCVSVGLLTGCGSATSTTSDTLKIGMECDYAPHNWTTTSAKATDSSYPINGSDALCDGYDVMIATRLAEEMGKELVIYKITWDGLIPSLQSGQIDAVIAGMSPTAERQEVINFSDSYYNDDSNQYMVVNKNSAYANATALNDFAGAKISAQLGTLQVAYIDQITDVQAIAPMDSYTTLMQATATGTIDGYIAEEMVAYEQAAANDNLVVVELINNETGFSVAADEVTVAIGVKKDNTALQAELNAALATISDAEREAMMLEATEMAGE
ncbi:MAG: transporter substrate-binding domain-containing protein [Culicoidibacterales bacterium]